ncbi:MAG: amidohydrolase family protein [Calditrichota bacterium]
MNELRLCITLLCLLLPALLGASDDKNKWDVMQHRAPADTFNFTVDEGTWINLDVSPDGKTIAFDLLGDIYTLPISSGKARPIATGLAWEVQPRFSPDGKHISFTSDRAGGDNIWIMKSDGSEPSQVTNESFRLLNNAVWMPDGDYLIAKKHFTSTRSLGAGEMWLYHRSGGAGVKLTTRKNDQLDVGEPAVSPNGRYLYFSEDMSGGRFFRYNKDPNTQIYVIRRLDLEKNKLINYITGQGGAVRPQVSPDGKYVSFLRRIRTKTVLFLHDIETGEQWPIYDELSKDQQETWATFGVYPGYDWMPDGKSIVIWAKGKIVNIDIASRNAKTIPFSVDVSISIAKAQLTRQETFSEKFTAKMIRHATTSPDGKWLVFNAAGHIWKKKLPNGKPKRLTKDSNVFEFEPAISPDGKWVAYTTWNDTALGSIRRVKLKGGSSVAVTSRKGYFYSPSWSPDGVMIVYRRGSGNSALGFSYGVDPGLYWIAEFGGDEQMITDEGSDPRFNKAGDRVLYRSWLNGKKALKSVTLDGNDPQTHFTSKYATEMAISPDERWIAWQELYNVYIMANPAVAAALDLSAGGKSLPQKKVTRDAGISLHWSANSQALHWTTGQEYFTRKLTDSFDFIPGAPDSLPAIDTTGTPINLVLDSDVPSGKIALVGARIITSKGDEVIEDGTIIIDQNRITDIGKRSDIIVPLEATTIDVKGKTIIPGLVDVHAHMNHWSGGISTAQNWSYMANLAFGVTTTHDPSASTEMVFSQSEMVKRGVMMGPRIFSTGTILYGAEGDFKAIVNSLDDARSHLRRMKSVGAFSVKSYNQPRRDQRQQIMQAAREMDMLVYPEGGSFFYHNMTMIADGHTGIEHTIPVHPIYDDIINFWKNSKTGYTPTLTVAYGGIWGENYWYQHTKVWENELLLNFVPRALVDSRSRRRTMAPKEEYGHFANAKTCKVLADVGVKVNLGAHGQMQGICSHWELWMLVQGGMSPLEAIHASTWNGAHYIGMEHEIGSLEKGKLADLVVLDANPLESIYNSEKIRYVMMNGRIYDASTLNEIGNHPKTRNPFYWENSRSSDGFVWRLGSGFSETHCGCMGAH